MNLFKDGKNDLRDGHVLVSLDQARSAIAKNLRAIGNFNIHIIWKSFRRIGQSLVPNGRKQED